MAEAPVKYRPLKDYVQRRGGLRLAMHPRLRSQLVELAVEEYPVGAAIEVAPEVLSARLTIRARRQYGKVMAFVLVSAAAVTVSKLVCEWHGKRHSHRVLMLGWQEVAKGAR